MRVAGGAERIRDLGTSYETALGSGLERAGGSGLGFGQMKD